MACNTEELEINDVQYVCTQYPAIQGMKFKLKVLKTLGPVITEIIPMIGKDAEDGDQLSAISNVIEKLFQISSPDEIVDLIVEMMTTGNVKREGKRITEALFTEQFSGDNMMEVYKVFAFVLKVNYKGFFKGQKAKELLAQVDKVST